MASENLTLGDLVNYPKLHPDYAGKPAEKADGWVNFTPMNGLSPIGISWHYDEERDRTVYSLKYSITLKANFSREHDLNKGIANIVRHFWNRYEALVRTETRPFTEKLNTPLGIFKGNLCGPGFRIYTRFAAGLVMTLWEDSAGYRLTRPSIQSGSEPVGPDFIDASTLDHVGSWYDAFVLTHEKRCTSVMKQIDDLREFKRDRIPIPWHDRI